jgi:hypothetical protein
MASLGYMQGRQRFGRPQGMLWSDTPGVLSNGRYIPSGYEEYSNKAGLTPAQIENSFIILTDHNRSDISITPQRIEKRQRMINGTMRSYHIADKLNISTSWQMVPSRGHQSYPDFDQTTGLPDSDFAQKYSERTAEGLNYLPNTEYTADGGAGGAEMLKWYQEHKGPFWVFLAYDKYINFGVDKNAHTKLNQYNQVVQMYISSFDYTVVKRGAGNHDLWNITVGLEEA